MLEVKDIQKNLVKQIKFELIEQDLNQSKLADMLDVDTSYISDVFNGKRGLSLKFLVRVCNVLNLTPNFKLDRLHWE